ncbi:MAG: hypothetical protein LBS11_01180 [Oscillospiraceae bacterium]|jgi:hypothetical protein|nr:hypothetical protein [Oscillospiraceae bacterium]
MYCMQVCETKKTLYGVPLEPLPNPTLFDDCAQENCASDDPQTGRGCLFDDFDPDVFNKPCCKSGCCAICSRIGDDAPYLVPHVISCMEPWPYAASTCPGTGRCLNHSIRIRINPLPTCLCHPTDYIIPLPVPPGPDTDCYAIPHSDVCCITAGNIENEPTGYKPLCIRVRGVPSVEFVEPAGSTISYVNDPNGYYLYARPTIHLEILLQDCCGYLFTVKSSYRFLNTMLLTFPLHCRLCELGEANIYLKTKIQLCDASPDLITPGLNGQTMFDFTVNLSVDACIVKHIPYDACGAASACLPSLVNGANNVSDPESVLALDAPYMVPFPIACRRFRSEREATYGPGGVPVYTCVSVGVNMPPLPGVGPWTVITVGSTGQTRVQFDDCLPSPCDIAATLPCLSPRACCEKHRENCSSHILELSLRTQMAITVRDSLGDTYTVSVDTEMPFNINLGTAWRNICRAWLYVKTKFSLCGGEIMVAGPGAVGLPIDTLIEACVMKLVPYQITGKDPHCNLGPWYYRNYCADGFRENCAALPASLEGASPEEAAAQRPAPEPAPSLPEDADTYEYYPDEAIPTGTRPSPARPIRGPVPAGCRKNRR